MVKEAILFVLDCSQSMVQTKFPYREKTSSHNRLSFAQEAVEEIIYHLLLQTSHTREIGVIACNLPDLTAATSDHSDDDDDDDNTESIQTHSDLSDGIDHDSTGDAPSSRLFLLEPVNVSILQNLHIHFGTEAQKSTLTPRSIRNVPAYQQSHGNVVDSIIQASEIFHQHSLKQTNKMTKTRFKIVLFTDASHRFTDIDSETLSEALQTLEKLSCTIFILGFDFIHSKVKHFTPATVDESSDSEKDDMGTHSISLDSSTVQSENETFIISLVKHLGGTLFPVYSHRTLKAAIKASLSSEEQSFSKKKIELVLANNLSISVRVSILISKANLPSLQKEVVLLSPESGEPMVNGAGEIMTSRIKTSTLHWDSDHPHVQVSELKQISTIQFGKNRFPLGVFDLHGLRVRGTASIRILGYVPFDTIPLGLLVGPARMIYGDTTRSCVALGGLSRSMNRMNLMALSTYVPRDDSDPQMCVLTPDVDKNNVSTNRLLLLRFPFADDIQNLGAASDVDFSVPLTKEEETSCDDLIDALMLPCNESNDGQDNTELPINPTIRLFSSVTREKVTHVHTLVPCSHHTYGDSSFIRWRKRSTVSNSVEETTTDDDDEEESSSVQTVMQDDEENNLLSTPKQILEKARPALEQFRSSFPLFIEPKERRRYWSDCY